MNSTILIFIGMAGILPAIPLFADKTPKTTYVTESPQEIEETYLNYPQVVPHGNAIQTSAGVQLTPGILPEDIAKNREIYNDVQRIENELLDLMRMINAIQRDPAMLAKAQAKLPSILKLITDLGVRYNLTEEFAIQKEALKAYMKKVEKSYQDYLNQQHVANPDQSVELLGFWVYRFNLEHIMNEITNKLLSKLSGGLVTTP